MDDLKFNSNVTDATYLTNSNIFLTAVFTLAIFNNGWPEEKLGSQAVLLKCLSWFKEMFEGGLTGSHLHIASRREARKDLDLRIRKILYYLTVMADEKDIAILVNTGVVSRANRKKSHKVAKPVVLPSN